MTIPPTGQRMVDLLRTGIPLPSAADEVSSVKRELVHLIKTMMCVSAYVNLPSSPPPSLSDSVCLSVCLCALSVSLSLSLSLSQSLSLSLYVSVCVCV